MKESKKNILISGASIAGLTLAYWLHKYGYKVAIVEIAGAPRKGGSPIDIKGEAVDVVRKMGIYEEIAKKKVTTERVCFVNENDKIIASMNPSIMDDKIGEDIEIQREFLVDILYEKVKESVDFIFENTITKIENNAENVIAHFKKGEPRIFDLVIGADGLHSNVRKLVFGKEEDFSKYYGMYAGVVDIEINKNRKNNCILYNTSGKMAGIYNFNNKANAILVFHSKEQIIYDYKNTKEQKEVLNKMFFNEGWKVPQILQKFNESETLYFDAVSQIKMDNWSKNRVVLIGDAAYCASFLTGRGASLAVLGAYTLAEAIKDSEENYSEAFQKYQKRFEPIANKAQSSIKAGALFLVPKTGISKLIRNLLVKTLVPLISILRK